MYHNKPFFTYEFGIKCQEAQKLRLEKKYIFTIKCIVIHETDGRIDIKKSTVIQFYLRGTPKIEEHSYLDNKSKQINNFIR